MQEKTNLASRKGKMSTYSNGKNNRLELKNSLQWSL